MPLLHDVRELVRQQAAASRRPGLVLAAVENEVTSQCKSSRIQRLSEPLGTAIRMHSHGSKITTESCLEMAPGRLWQGLTVAAQSTDLCLNLRSHRGRFASLLLGGQRFVLIKRLT